MASDLFEVEFLSNIVLLATSNTEGSSVDLDFIPGSNFLGMVAREYDKFEDSFAVFHSGKVRFGDATILQENRPTYKVPLSYFHQKLDIGENKAIYNHHLLKDKESLGQLKQIRNGYITKENELVSIEYSYAQKSAYDSQKRKSKDSAMYGYNAINKGTKWQFTLKYEDISGKDLERIKNNLIGEKRLGKSKSSQYGRVRISLSANSLEDITSQSSKNQEIYLYANSRLALVDENGNPTYDLKYLCEGLESATIDYAKTQIRTSTFTPYHGAMQTKTYERVCINKGSVIVLKSITDKQLDEIKKGVGVYLSEGFGDVLINPSFLSERELKLTPSQKEKTTQKSALNNPILQFLQHRESSKKQLLDIAQEVDDFITKNKNIYTNIKSSQWGNIRSIASSNQDNFIELIKEYIDRGTKKWEERQQNSFINAINKHQIDKQKFTKLLAMRMGGNNESK